jgi:hypothetical protein
MTGDMMQRYSNVDGDSSVAAYECGQDSITVEFTDGKAYIYTYASCGQANCDQMKRLAASGTGLNSFIMRTVRNHYARQLR